MVGANKTAFWINDIRDGYHYIVHILRIRNVSKLLLRIEHTFVTLKFRDFEGQTVFIATSFVETNPQCKISFDKVLPVSFKLI